MPITFYVVHGFIVMEAWGKVITAAVVTLYMLFSTIPMYGPGTVQRKLLICFHLLYCYVLALCLMASWGW